jgi:hypothetical protein
MTSLSVEEVNTWLVSGRFELQPTQRKLCFPILKRIYHKMKMGVAFDGINVAGKLLINGHHRYICALLLHKQLPQNTWGKPSNLLVYEWREMQVDTNDWESKELVERHNLKDAIKSGIDMTALEIG